MNTTDIGLPAELTSSEVTPVPKGTVLFSAGDECRLFVFVVSGKIRVDLTSDSGNNILLYRLNPNDTCVLTTSCLMSSELYCAEATVEEAASIITMPADQFFNSMDRSKAFRSFVFSSFSQRLGKLMAKVDEVSFRSIDRRLASSLLHHAEGEKVVGLTHDILATEIGTAREVISRKLSKWESAGLINRGRGEIHLLAVDHLQSIANAK